MTCDIIMVTWNAAAMTRTALASLHANANYPHRLIIVDNASDAETVALLERAVADGTFGEARLIRNTENAGWLRAANQGLDAATGEFLCLVNNDVVAGPNWLKNMIGTLEAQPRIGLANPRGDRRGENRRVADVDAHAVRLERERAGRYCELDHCTGFCLLIPRAVYAEVGPLDEEYGQGFLEDNDYSRRVQQAGYACARIEDAYVQHLKHQSFGAVPTVVEQLYADNFRRFEARWGKPARCLILPRRACADEVLALARAGSVVYVVQNRFLHPGSFAVPHDNIRFLHSLPARFCDRLYFLGKGAYFKRRGRIDAMRVLDDRAGPGLARGTRP